MLRVRVKKIDVDTKAYEDIMLPLLDLHLVMDFLFTTGGVDIPADIVNRFWYIKWNLAQEEWAINSPATSNHIPVALYGDACVCKGQVKILGIFASLPLWRGKSSRCSRWCLCAFEEARLWGTETLNTIMKRIAFSLNMLFDAWDSERGVALAGGQKFTLTELRGDWLYHKQLWNFSSKWTALTNVCYRCDSKGRSNNPNKLYWQIDDHEWHEYSVAEFLTEQLGNTTPCSATSIYKHFLSVFFWWVVVVSSSIIIVVSSLILLYLRPADPGEGVASTAASNMQYACGELGAGIQVQRVIDVSWLSDWLSDFSLNILGFVDPPKLVLHQLQ